VSRFTLLPGFSIAAGLSAGIILYPFTKVVSGRANEVSLVTWILAVIFLARYVFTTWRFG
jgi:AGZA family xanthine/uracil permease-like MFS transporter